MKLTNFEFKARLNNQSQARAILKQLGARLVGTDHQVDTYFRVPSGRLKVREGRIENALIFYKRTNARRARRSTINMMPLPRRNCVKAILSEALGVLAVVDKRRQIYFAGNVKIHLDRVRDLGNFVEVEAITRSGDLRKVRAQARKFQKLLAIVPADIVPLSYSDMILERRAARRHLRLRLDTLREGLQVRFRTPILRVSSDKFHLVRGRKATRATGLIIL
jgi:adenylate cyclase, class 2